MNHTKVYPKDLDFPRRELSNCGLEIVVALLVCSGLVFCVCSYWKSNPAVVCGPILQLKIKTMQDKTEDTKSKLDFTCNTMFFHCQNWSWNKNWSPTSRVLEQPSTAVDRKSSCNLTNYETLLAQEIMLFLQNTEPARLQAMAEST